MYTICKPLPPSLRNFQFRRVKKHLFIGRWPVLYPPLLTFLFASSDTSDSSYSAPQLPTSCTKHTYLHSLFSILTICFVNTCFSNTRLDLSCSKSLDKATVSSLSRTAFKLLRSWWGVSNFLCVPHITTVPRLYRTCSWKPQISFHLIIYFKAGSPFLVWFNSNWRALNILLLQLPFYLHLMYCHQLICTALLHRDTPIGFMVV